MKKEDKQALVSAFNDLKQMEKDFPNLPLGGAARIKNSLHNIGKLIKDVPDRKDGFKDFEFIYS